MSKLKQLQNNYTTAEQSKRLLEFGVPADSADCYLTRFGIDEDWEVKVLNYVKYSELAISNQKYCLPCWSVGRLMEIFEICTGETFERNDVYNIFSDIFTSIESALLNHKMDFSKLED